MTEPLFLTFEGLDGSGKSTHLEVVAARLRDAGVSVCVTREPGGTPLGTAIRDIFLDPKWGVIDGGVELMLVFASRRQHLLEVIEPALAEGKVVLCDRFTDSTYAYQGAGRGVPADVIDRMDDLATGRRTPDRTILLDLPAEEAQRRGQSAKRQKLDAREGGVDRIDAEKLDFYRRVREGFLERARLEPERFRVAQSARPRREVELQVRDALSDLFGAVLEGVE